VPILIDGHNLIGRMPTLSLRDAHDEEELVRLLISYQARTGKAITVVFDPGETFALAQARRLGGLEVVFAPHGSSADAAIVRRMRQSRNPAGWLVITSDQELATDVTHLGARVQTAEAFAAGLGRPAEESPDWKDMPPSPDEVDAWLSLFDIQDE
jgi:predicted RNA-binding protein with PIN domain